LTGPLIAVRGLAYRGADYLQIRQSPLCGINPVATDTYAGFAGCPAATGACHGTGFSASCGARNVSRMMAVANQPAGCGPIENEERCGGE
jgi:hypothetical protein